MINYTWKNSCLTLAGISTYLTTAYIIIVPQAGDRPVANFQFPQQIKLNSATTFVSKDSTKTTSATVERSPTLITKKQIFQASNQYQSFQDGRAIDLETNYIVDTTGNVETYLQNYTSLAPKIIKNKTIKQIEGIGYHALFVKSDRAYLTSCISPRSPSSITQRQFSQYRYQNDLKPQVVWHWLQGKASIRDRRCLWINLSTPLNTNLQTAYQSLETTWQEVYRWWLPNFPSL